jgi:hypothetical protein
MSFTLDVSLNLGSSQTGLVLKASLYDFTGALVAGQKDIATGFSEQGKGNYLWHYANFPDGFRGGIGFYVGTIGGGNDFSAVDLKATTTINPEELSFVSAVPVNEQNYETDEVILEQG